ncbi:MAG: HAMP domain-containing protein, partial [Alphaproteobacteria bacterium]|nr:HAMP domain-containing protein [Alphaproteobacteria bacterium]
TVMTSPAAADAARALRGLNIRLKLSLAFGAVLALTLVAGGVGFVSFELIGASMRQIVDDNLPAITATQRLAATSGQIAAAAPLLIAAASDSELSKDYAGLVQKTESVGALIKTLQERRGADAATLEQVAKIAENVQRELTDLYSVVDRRLSAEHDRLEALKTLDAAHAAFLKLLAPGIDEGNFNLMVDGEAALEKTNKGLAGLMEGGVATLRGVLEVQVAGTDIAGLLIEAANAPSPDRANVTRDRITAMSNAATRSFKALPQTPEVAGLRTAYDAIVALTTGPASVYALPFARPDASLADVQAVQRARYAFVERIHAAHADFAAKAIALVDGANFELVLSGEDLAKKNQGTLSQLMESGVTSLRSLLELQAEGNLLVGLIREAANTELTDRFVPMRERAQAVIKHMQGAVAAVADKKLAANLETQLDVFKSLVVGSDNVIDAREQELKARAGALAALARNRELAEKFDASVGKMVADVQRAAESAGGDSETQIERGMALLVAIMIASVVVCLLVGWLVVTRNIAQRIARLTRSMREIADGDLDAKVTIDGRDEITAMARTLGVFRDTAREVAGANARTEAERTRAAAERRAEMAKLANDFEATIKGVVESLSSAATEMQATAKQMAANATDTSTQSTTVATASGEATSNVQTVAAAAEQLSSSIGEIGRQVNESAQIAERAVSEADRTNITVKGLASAAARIGEVVKLINEIANQTNLLALNATIEAARAGEAGKGFAVVAGEVKNLASQTARATEDIAAQIGAIQSSTSEAVAAIDTIGGTIGQINAIASSIATAVEQQGAATAAIARNVQDAARGTQQVSSTIGRVTLAAEDTGRAAQHVLALSSSLSDQSDALRAQVDQFLAGVRGS